MHFIQQHTLDIQCSSQDFGKELHSQLRLLLEKEFYPQLERLFNKYEIKNHIWNIELLTIDLPTLSQKYWKQELIQKSLHQIEEYLKRHSFFSEQHQINSDSTYLIAKEKQASQLFFQFLKTGWLTENSISKDIEGLVLEIKIDKLFIDELLHFFENNPSALVRWIFALPHSFKRNFLKKTKGFTNEIAVFLNHSFEENGKEDYQSRKSLQKVTLNTILKKQWIELIQWLMFLQKRGTSKSFLMQECISLSEKYWELEKHDLEIICDFMVRKTKKNQDMISNEIILFFQTIAQAIAYKPIPNHADKPIVDYDIKGKERELLIVTENSATATPINTLKYISNGGLVLLHPFLKSLFEQLNLCEANGNWKSKLSQHKAILLTQYLIDGSTRIHESDLVLNKILCGFPIVEIVNVKLKITKKEKQKCLRLLEAVKAHWKVMNHSSFEAIQQTFLQREAKLECTNGKHFELWIEEKGVDILLEQLPWGIATIQTPWMENYLNCYWN